MAVYGADSLWGCLRINFTANPPFNEMKQDFAAFKKETHMALGQQDIPELFENLPGGLRPWFLEVTILFSSMIYLKMGAQPFKPFWSDSLYLEQIVNGFVGPFGYDPL